MKFKISMLAALLVAALPFSAQAQDTNSYEALNVSCESGAECNDFGVEFQGEGDEVAQSGRTRRTRTRRSRRRNDSKIYAGGTFGLYFPSEIGDTDVDPGTGFGGTFFGGYKINEFISAEAETLLAFGGSDVEVDGGSDIDGAYTLFSFFVNPRFTYAFNKGSDKSPYIFASPGLGFGNLNIRGDVGDAIDDAGGDSSGSGFALQGKIGAGYPITDKLDIVGQARYANIFNVFEVTDTDGDTEDEDVDFFGIEAGVSFKF